MHDTLTLLAVLTTWGLIPAAVHVLVQLMIARSADRQIRQHRTLDWPRVAHMDTQCTEHTTLCYIERAHDDALRNEVTTVAQRALSDPSTHIEN